MIKDIPHAKTILLFGLGGFVLLLILLTWIYPAYCERYHNVREDKLREHVESTFGVSERSNPFTDTPVLSTPLTEEELSEAAASSPDYDVNSAPEDPDGVIEDSSVIDR